jgi:hypothetical protein
MTTGTGPADPADDVPPFRYTAELAQTIETGWQHRWADEGTYNAPNPQGELSEGFDRVAIGPHAYIMDMFPYPSGDGLHVGHPLGYIGTDVYARYRRMGGDNVLHTMGFDAFGLPSSARSRPGSTPASRRTTTSTPSCGSCAAWDSATTSGGASRPPTRRTTSGRSGSSCRSSTPGTTRWPTRRGRSMS